MIFAIIILIVLGITFSRKSKKYKSDENDLVIRYDKILVKRLALLFLAMICIVVVLYVIIDLDDLGTIYIVAEVAGMLITTFYLLIIGIFVCLFVLVDAGVYFLQLKKHGYIIPINRADYEDVTALEKTNRDIVYVAYDKITLGFAIVSLICFLINIVVDCIYIYEWNIMKDSAWAMFLIVLFCDFVWIAVAFMFYMQSNNEKYRDIFEVDAGRKKRMVISDAIALVVTLIVISVVGQTSVRTMTDYVYKSNIAVLRDSASIIQKAFVDVNDSLLIDMDDESKATYEELCQGVDITEFDSPYNKYQQEILRLLEKKSFTDIINNNLIDDDANIIVKFDDASVSVQIVKKDKFGKKNIDIIVK